MSKNFYRVLVVTLLLLSGPYFVKAATYTAAVNGNWNSPLSWGLITGTPTSADIVIIPSGVTVTVNITTATASSLTITGTGKLAFNANEKLAVSGNLSNAGTITMNTGTTMSVGATFTNTGTVTTSSGTLSIAGNLSNAAMGTVTVSTGTLSIGGSLVNPGSVTATTGTLTIGSATTNSGTLSSSGGSLSLGGSLTNSGSFTSAAGGTLTFKGLGNSTISASGGTYSIGSNVVMNMGSKTVVLDVQDPNFISGINTGGKYYFTFTQGTFKMDNNGTLNNAYNNGSTTALSIPYAVVLESDDGTMNLASKGTNGNVMLSGQLFMNGGTVNVQLAQTAVADFRYTVSGGTPQLYINSGTLTVGGGFNAKNTTDYIDFKMTGGTMEVTNQNSSNNPTFQLQNVAGGKTNMTGGLIMLDQPSNGNYNDLDMGGPNISTYSVTGGTVQLGGPGFPYNNAANFWIAPYNTTNYPNLYDYALNCGSVMAQTTGSVNALSLYISPGTTFDASNISTLNLTSSTGVYALDDEGTFTAGNNTIKFSGGLAQAITSSALSNVNLYNLAVANTSGNVVLGVQTTVTNTLSFTSGDVDASTNPLIISSGNAITGVGNSSYVITGDGATKLGYLAIQKLTKNATTTFPIGTSTYYLPLTIAPGNNTNTAYSAYVYKGVTTTGLASGSSEPGSVLVDMTDATWVIARTAGAGTPTFGLNWASAGTALEGTYFKTFGTNIGITQFSGGSWGPATGSGNEATHTASSSFSSFGSFSVIGNPTALPLVLGNFNAAPQGKTSLLTWAAFPDGQAGSFTIQRSLDGSSWTDIGVVQADATATVEISYSFTDVAPAAGQNDYRLYIQNEDGSTSYSVIRVVEFSAAAASLSIYPNPANTTLAIGVGSSGKQLGIRLVNTAGTTLQTKIVEAGTATVTMGVGSYPPGIYYVEVFEGGQVVQTTTVLVAH